MLAIIGLIVWAAIAFAGYTLWHQTGLIVGAIVGFFVFLIIKTWGKMIFFG